MLEPDQRRTLRRSITTNSASSATATASVPTVRADPQPYCCALTIS